MAVVLEAVALRAAGRHGEHRHGAVQRLESRLLVHAEDDGVFRGIQVPPDHVRRLLLEVRVVRRQVSLQPVRPEVRTPPRPVHDHVTDAQVLPQPSRAPVRRAIGGRGPNHRQDLRLHLRSRNQPHMKELYELGNTMAEAAAAMTSTKASWRILGHAYPRHFNKPVAETLWANIERVGLPEWSEADQTLARGLQRELGVEERGLAMELGQMGGPAPEPRLGGFSDDIGDISWKVPTVTMRYPANIPGGPGHHWANAVAMATPIAHKGVTAGARVIAMTLMDLFLDPSLVEAAKDYFAEQTAEHQYSPLIGPNDPPAIHLNKEGMDSFREAMRPFYYDPERYDSYLEQLGIEYPTVREGEREN